MIYRILLFISIIFLFSCNNSFYKDSTNNIPIEKRYKNIGFALIYDDSLDNIKKMDNRSLDIYHKTLKKNSIVKITNPRNGNFLIAKVRSNNVKFSNFYNSVLTIRIAESLELDLDEPYVEIILTSKNSTFVAKKAKTFKEERTVAQKAPIDGIQINDLNLKENKKKNKKKTSFSYSIKVADFYYKDTAKIMVNRIKEETLLKNLSIMKISPTKFRVLIGPFNDIKSLRDSFEKMNLFNFENLEVLKNV